MRNRTLAETLLFQSASAFHTICFPMPDVVKWCNARSEKEGRTPAYYTNSIRTKVFKSGHMSLLNNWVNWNAGYRLPTEAEWERTARGSMQARFPDGDTITHGNANYFSSSSLSYDTSPTRGFHPLYLVYGKPSTR